MARSEGFEPSLTDSKSVVLPLHYKRILEHGAGFEPAINGFADRRLTAWLSVHGGKCEIRTRGAVTPSGFRNQRIRPLCQLSIWRSEQDSNLRRVLSRADFPSRCHKPLGHLTINLVAEAWESNPLCNGYEPCQKPS
jgi:hypothetical protein